jgi:hypothetical protein
MSSMARTLRSKVAHELVHQGGRGALSRRQAHRDRWLSLDDFKRDSRALSRSPRRRHRSRRAMGPYLVHDLNLRFPKLAGKEAKPDVMRNGQLFVACQTDDDLLVSTASSSGTDMNAFRERLRELGYVEGQSITIESRYWEGKVERPRPRR